MSVEPKQPRAPLEHHGWHPDPELRFDARYDWDGEDLEIELTIGPSVWFLGIEQAERMAGELAIACVQARAVFSGLAPAGDPWALSTPTPRELERWAELDKAEAEAGT